MPKKQGQVPQAGHAARERWQWLLHYCQLLNVQFSCCMCVQVLLRWVLQYGVAAVCEAAGKEIDRANVGVFEWELKPADFKKLSNIKPS